jgi:adenine phosphoribosyltransferase
MPIKSKIRTAPHYPKQGIQFCDTTTLLKNPVSFRATIDELAQCYQDVKIDKIAGIKACGFIFGAALAYALGKGFILVRKKGKLPAVTIGNDCALEYGIDRIEIHAATIQKGDRVLMVDNLVATGGTAGAACTLIDKMGGKIVECCFIIDLPDIGGRARLEKHGHKVFAHASSKAISLQ